VVQRGYAILQLSTGLITGQQQRREIMFTKSLKTVLAAGVLAVGAATTMAAPANAGGNFGVYIGGSHGGGIYIGKHHGQRYSGHRRDYRRHYRRDHRRSCNPRRALNKAYRYGLNRPHIQRVNNRKIVVVGKNRGHRAKIVFSRHGRGCQIIRTRGI